MSNTQDKEHYIALMEGHMNAASDAHFKARHDSLDTRHSRVLYEAGFKRAWGILTALQPPAPQPPGDAREATTHDLKLLPTYFAEVQAGTKTFELRKDDRGFEVGDTLCLREWSEPSGYSGRQEVRRVVGLVRGPVYGLADGWVILSIAPLQAALQPAAAQPQGDAREAFEAWARKEGRPHCIKIGAKLVDTFSIDSWNAWQAATAQASEPSAPNPSCEYCQGTGEADSGGSHPWGAQASIRCRCTYPLENDLNTLTTPPPTEPWRTVPVEPTKAMLDAGREACEGNIYPQDMLHGPRAMMADRWYAMLNAAPARAVEPLTITEDVAWNLAKYVYAHSNPHESPQILLSAMEIKQIIERAHGIPATTPTTKAQIAELAETISDEEIMRHWNRRDKALGGRNAVIWFARTVIGAHLSATTPTQAAKESGNE